MKARAPASRNGAPTSGSIPDRMTTVAVGAAPRRPSTDVVRPSRAWRGPAVRDPDGRVAPPRCRRLRWLLHPRCRSTGSPPGPRAGSVGLKRRHRRSGRGRATRGDPPRSSSTAPGAGGTPPTWDRYAQRHDCGPAIARGRRSPCSPFRHTHPPRLLNRSTGARRRDAGEDRAANALADIARLQNRTLSRYADRIAMSISALPRLRRGAAHVGHGGG